MFKRRNYLSKRETEDIQLPIFSKKKEDKEESVEEVKEEMKEFVREKMAEVPKEDIFTLIDKTRKLLQENRIIVSPIF